MALEPETVTADSGPSLELADMSRPFRIGFVLASPVFVFEMGGYLLRHAPRLERHLSNGVQFALASPVVLWAGWPFFQRGWASLISRHLNMFTLIAMSLGASCAYSVVATGPGVSPPALRSADCALPVYCEAVAVITVLVLLGQVLEQRVGEQTGGAIRRCLT